MRMSDFVIREAILPRLTASSKEDVVRQMVEALRVSGHLKSGETESIIEAILKREQLGSTGIGRGVAIPHAKHESVERLLGSIAIAPEGVDFDSLDNEPVHIFILLMSPKDRPGEHLRALENVTRHLRDDSFCRFLKQAATREAIWDLLTQAEQAVK
jgi:mannitol/fructose-specific phosphotransferase system IIA component (Ntr-type)